MNVPSTREVFAHLEEHKEEVERMVEMLVLSLLLNGRSMEAAGIDRLCVGFILDVASTVVGEIALDHYSEDAAPLVIALAKKVKGDLDARADAREVMEKRDASTLRPTQRPGKA